MAAEAGRYGEGMIVQMSTRLVLARSLRSPRLRRQPSSSRGCGGDSTDAAATTDTVATTTAPEPVTTTATTTAPEPTTTTDGPTTITIVVKNAAPDGGIKRATVAKGDNVVLVVHSDVADEIHLHGYNLSTDVAAGGVATHPLRRHRARPVRGRARAARRADRRPHRHAVGRSAPRNVDPPTFRFRQQVVGEA